MLHRLPELAYGYDALRPQIGARTLRTHYEGHHAAYVLQLNALLAEHAVLVNMPLEDIIHDIRVVPEEMRQEVRNIGGAHLNHSLLWRTLSPRGGGDPDGALKDAIVERWADTEIFRDDFRDVAMSRFGAGWAWLAADHNGRLDMLSTPNEDAPIMLGYHPVLGIDLWEHAYYLDYPNRREAYIDAWWNLVDWRAVAEIYRLNLELLRHPQNS